MFFEDKKLNFVVQEMIEFLAYHGFVNFTCTKTDKGFNSISVDGKFLISFINNDEILLTKDDEVVRISVDDKMKLIDIVNKLKRKTL